MKYLIGVDVGGMSVKIGLVNDLGQLIDKKVFETEFDPHVMAKIIADDVFDLLKNNDIKQSDLLGIGVGVPGTVDAHLGEIDFCDNLHWSKIPFVKLLNKYIDTHVVLGNDANAAVLGELKFGSAKQFSNVVMITLGTGVGGGIVIDGKVYEGVEGKAAEIGHMTLYKGGEQCTCGRKGCFERYASATALIASAKKAMLEDKNSLMWEYVKGDLDAVDGKVPFECSKKGDSAAIKVIDEYVSNLSEGMISLMNIFRPETIILGGGVSHAGEYLLNKVIDYCEKEDYGYKNAPKTKILIAELGNNAGIIGAAALAL